MFSFLLSTNSDSFSETTEVTSSEDETGKEQEERLARGEHGQQDNNFQKPFESSLATSLVLRHLKTDDEKLLDQLPSDTLAKYLSLLNDIDSFELSKKDKARICKHKKRVERKEKREEKLKKKMAKASKVSERMKSGHRKKNADKHTRDKKGKKAKAKRNKKVSKKVSRKTKKLSKKSSKKLSRGKTKDDSSTSASPSSSDDQHAATSKTIKRKRKRSYSKKGQKSSSKKQLRSKTGKKKRSRSVSSTSSSSPQKHHHSKSRAVKRQKFSKENTSDELKMEKAGVKHHRSSSPLSSRDVSPNSNRSGSLFRSPLRSRSRPRSHSRSRSGSQHRYRFQSRSKSKSRTRYTSKFRSQSRSPSRSRSRSRSPFESRSRYKPQYRYQGSSSSTTSSSSSEREILDPKLLGSAIEATFQESLELRLKYCESAKENGQTQTYRSFLNLSSTAVPGPTFSGSLTPDGPSGVLPSPFSASSVFTADYAFNIGDNSLVKDGANDDKSFHGASFISR